MLCDVCGKNQATVHLTEIVDEQMTELHLCEGCAKQKSMQMEQQFGLSDLLAGLADFGKHTGEIEPLKLKCPNCNLTYEDFKKIGRLGCSSCYSTFIRYLLPLLKRIHGTTVHTGKVPKGAAVGVSAADSSFRKTAETTSSPKNDMLELKTKLQEAVRLENFEEAAKLRDKLKELENKPSGVSKNKAPARESSRRKKEQG
ncbi:MAG: UvrB/UvrC motif-containing protein [Candidatus Omnitrophica bacterium]|nr:UvrB/UvrC motif-containing protein [Candidatus Omnitrophota bacterium]MDD5355326.1 UvrB/UvrC motif-containing protein [Candidatus Omnitrophota bacterium]